MMRRSMMGRARAFEDGADAEGVFDALFEESAATNSSMDDGHRARRRWRRMIRMTTAAADASPLLNDAFREALAGRKSAWAKRDGPRWRRLMRRWRSSQRVRAERAMNAESAKKPEASRPLGDARGGERGGANGRRGGKDARADAGTGV